MTPLAIVTGPSPGIGYERAAMCARQGFDLLVAVDRPEITLTGMSGQHRRMAAPGSGKKAGS